MERPYIWSLRVSICQSSLFSKHFTGWKIMKVIPVVSMALLVVATSPAKSDLNLCCCGTTFLITGIAELTYILPDNYLADSFDTWHVYTPCCTLNLQSLQWQSMHVWAYIEKCAKYFKQCTHYNARQCMSFTLIFAWNCDCRMVFKNQFSHLFWRTENWLCSNCESSGIQRAVSSIPNSVQEQQLYVEIKV